MVLSYSYFPSRPLPRPIIPVRLRYNDKLLDVGMLLDSGSDFSMIPVSISEALGINIKRLKKTKTIGIGGIPIEVKMSELGLILKRGREEYDLSMPVQINLNPDVIPLLGRTPLFDEFDVTFRQWKNQINLKKMTEKDKVKRRKRVGK
ncbi:MAG: hypothetical protein JSW00_15670 [Thermoplasmata archaeon]|nr:MAG: hypothetical protein JSW00_15670 [Thermoplasmata archaeon]